MLGSSPGLQGLVGQAMTGAKAVPAVRNLTVPVMTSASVYGAGSYTAPEDQDVFVFVTGGGAHGGSSGTSGAGGGGASYRRFRLLKGRTISYVAAAPASGVSLTNGNDSTATFPDGVTITGQGGQGGQGGKGINGDLNRAGGAGGPGSSPGTAGEFGGAGGGSAGGVGSGGGAAGFSDVAAFPAGSGGNSGGGGATFPGGASGGSTPGSPAGQVIIIAVSVQR